MNYKPLRILGVGGGGQFNEFLQHMHVHVQIHIACTYIHCSYTMTYMSAGTNGKKQKSSSMQILYRFQDAYQVTVIHLHH